MRTIKKYALTSGASFKVKMPKGYAILRAGIEERCPHLWAIVDTSNVDVMASLHMVNTNAPMVELEGLQYLGSVQIPGNPFYSHLFIDTKGDVEVAVPHPAVVPQQPAAPDPAKGPGTPTADRAPQTEGQGGNPPA